MENKNINVKDLNGLEDIKLKVITKTIQEPDPVKFSGLCESLFNGMNPEMFISWSVSNVSMQTNRGMVLIYIGNLQYWATEAEYNAWLDELKRSNLFIKP